MKMKLSQKYYCNTMSCLWTTGIRNYDDKWETFSCTDEFGQLIYPTFGHYGSDHVISRKNFPFSLEYEKRIKIFD